MPRPVTDPAQTPVVVLLTPREAEVLGLIAEGMTVAQVAVKLVVEQSTVRSHLKTAYKKLKVNSQAAAVAAAIRQELIS